MDNESSSEQKYNNIDFNEFEGEQIKTKKCKYCMSDINELASICPNCRKKQPKTKHKMGIVAKGAIFIVSIISVMSIIYVIIVCNEYSNISNESFYKSKAKYYLSTSSTQFMLEDQEQDFMCYYIDDGIYNGSVKIEKNGDGEIEAYIWLSDGTYYVTGDEDDITVIRSSKTAPTNCHRY